jgi:hypothetical protein
MPKKPLKRKKTTQNNQRRRRDFGIGYGVICTLVVIALLIAAVAVFFRLASFEIVGETAYSRAEIINASGLSVGDNLYFFNKFAVQEKMCETLPYLGRVRITRSLPKTLVITVEETSAVAAVETDAEWVLINAEGKALERVDSPEDLCQINGIRLATGEPGRIIKTDPASAADTLIAILSVLHENGNLHSFTSFTVDGAFSVKAVYADRIRVDLGLVSDNVYRKALALAKILERLDDDVAGTLDMTGSEYRFIPDTQPAATPTPEPEEAPPEG